MATAPVEGTAPSVEAELGALHAERGGLEPADVVEWARKHTASALHARFTWDDSIAAHQYRLVQARQIITSVTVIYPDGQTRPVYCSLLERRGNGAGGYTTLVSVMSDAEKRAAFLAQALAEYERLGVKYQSLVELANVREAVAEAAAGQRKRKR